MNSGADSNPVTIGLVGCGFMGSMHAQVYRQLPPARVVAAADPRVEASVKKLRQLGWPVPVYPSQEELLRRHPEIGVVDLCTPFDAVFETAAVDYDSSRSPALRITRSDRAPEPLAFAAPEAGSSQTGEGNLSSLGGYYNELRSFVADVAAGRAPAEATAADARNSLALVLREIESARRGETLDL